MNGVGAWGKTAWAWCLVLMATTAHAQTPEVATPAVPATATTTAPAQPEPGMVTLNFPENMELKALIDYVGLRLGVNFIYDEQIGSKKVTIKTPSQVPAASLMTLLESALKMKGLAMSRTEVAGMMRVEPARQLTATSVGPGPAVEAPAGGAVTRAVALKHATPQRVEQVITPFLSTPTASITALPEHKMLIVTEYADNMRRIEDLVALIDRPGKEVTTRFITIKNLEAVALAQQVTQLLAGQARAADAGATQAPAGVMVLADDRTNQIAVVGAVAEAAEAVALIASLDVSLGMETKLYTFATASAEQVDRLVKRMIGELAAKRHYKSTTDRDANLLIATATPEVHQQIEALRQTLDRPVSESQSPIRFYKLENAKAAAVLSTLQSIEGDTGLAGVSVDGVMGRSGPPAETAIRGPTEAQVNSAIPREASSGGEMGPRRESSNLGGRVMADEPSNTIIVVATPAMHPVYEKLIKRLDVRRPQVLIEATLVTVDTTNGFELGVEFSKTANTNGGEGKVLNFTQFGLSTTDPKTGVVTLKPGVGFNGALISSDIATVVIRALETDSRAKVVARPSVLVNDNATGKLVSQNEEPYASVNASSTVATTSFGGYSSAGTNISITPQISEGDHLKLEYEITLSSFGEDGSSELPPSRQTNSLKSEATIPNGYTIVLGGLTRESMLEETDRVPVLGRIPVLEYLFSSRGSTKRKATLFVFIRAVILRDDKFADLKALSDTSTGQADVAESLPVSEPVELR